MKQFVPFITEINPKTVTQRKFLPPKKVNFMRTLLLLRLIHTASAGRLFDRLKNWTGRFVHKGPFNIFALFTPNLNGWTPKFWDG